MWIYLLQGIGYGLAAASQPGPFQTYLISQTLTRGWKRTLPAALALSRDDGGGGGWFPKLKGVPNNSRWAE